MKMKYLKTFENFSDQDFGRFTEEEDQLNGNENELENEDEFADKFAEDEDEFGDENDEFDDLEDEYSSEEEGEGHLKRFGDFDSGCKTCGGEFDEEGEETEEDEEKVWGDELVEGKKNKFDKKDLVKAAKESAKKISKFKDGCKNDKCKCDKEEKKEEKGLTKAQKKLPEGLRKAIEAKKNKKK